MLKGILFDMDGVLVDSEDYIFEAAKLMFAEHGINVIQEDALPFIGTGENSYISGIGGRHGFIVDIERDKARTYEIYGQICKGKLEPLPGTIAFIEKCRSKGLKMAVASSADKIKIMINLHEIGIPENTFAAIVNGQDVERKKPFPDIYIQAAEMLGLQPQECLVVEDAVSGIKAGKAAGSKCLALTTSFSKDQLSEADWIVDFLNAAPDEVLSW